MKRKHTGDWRSCKCRECGEKRAWWRTHAELEEVPPEEWPGPGNWNGPKFVSLTDGSVFDLKAAEHGHVLRRRMPEGIIECTCGPWRDREYQSVRKNRKSWKSHVVTMVFTGGETAS